MASSKVGRKSLAYLTALATILALVPMMAGTANATHGQGTDADIDVSQFTLTPESSTAASGSCQPFTASATFGGAPAEGETIDIQATISDDDGTAGTTGELADATLAFCTPTGTPTPDAVADGGDEPLTDTDDDATVETAATVHGECVTNASGQCRFGLSITDGNANSSGTVEVWAETTDNDDRDSGEPFESSTIAVTASGNEAVTNISCTPATDTNPEGTRHEFRCTATNASAQPVGGATVLFDVTAGPNAEEVGPTNCPGTTASDTGQTGVVGAEASGGGTTPTATGCGYTDNQVTGGTGPVASAPGTDTITVCLTQQAGAGEAQTAGCDPHETQTTISKSWVGPANTISCTPDGLQALSGSSVTVTCSITDANGNAATAAAGDIQLVKTSGPGNVTNNTCNSATVTGSCSATVSTNSNEQGTTVMTGTMIGATNCGGTHTAPTADTGTTATCSDTSTIEWVERIEEPDPEIRERERSIRLARPRHANLGGRRRLLLRATISSADFQSCATQVPVNFQVRAGGTWVTIKSDTTNQNGVAKGLVQDLRGKYRAKAPKFQIEDTDNNVIDVCVRAISNKRRHRHG